MGVFRFTKEGKVLNTVIASSLEDAKSLTEPDVLVEEVVVEFSPSAPEPTKYFQGDFRELLTLSEKVKWDKGSDEINTVKIELNSGKIGNEIEPLVDLLLSVDAISAETGTKIKTTLT